MSARAQSQLQLARVALPGGRFYQPPPGDPYFSRPLPRSQPLATQTVVDFRALAAAKRWFPLEALPRAAERELVARRQKSARWLAERHGCASGTTLQKLLGFTFGRFESVDAHNAAVVASVLGVREKIHAGWETPYDAAVSDLTFADDRDEAIGRERMQWGNDHEDDAAATLLHARPSLSLQECVLDKIAGPAVAAAQEARFARKRARDADAGAESAPADGAAVGDDATRKRKRDADADAAADAEDAAAEARDFEQSRVGDSSDGYGVVMSGGTDEDGMPLGTPFAAEFKCATGNRDPQVYSGTKNYYVPQCLAHMAPRIGVPEAKRPKRCYFECWTPTKTRIWLCNDAPALRERIYTFLADIVSLDPKTLRQTGSNEFVLDETYVLNETAYLRAQCTAYARSCQEISGSPFDSCFALRDAAGKVLGVGADA